MRADDVDRGAEFVLVERLAPDLLGIGRRRRPGACRVGDVGLLDSFGAMNELAVSPEAQEDHRNAAAGELPRQLSDVVALRLGVGEDHEDPPAGASEEVP
jgi:hypothetical protein